ncbi:TonB-dependent receptor [Oecophyllibacter saccharovorans]|uniref:TonB-dependent receptor n=1 Tax=Oecophyllibacter saccharovorans TaxID=2558360 RepID=UPI001F4F3BF1|nr:TonB-dependent receptor [Oecophyllibacter saccharovorans]
MSALSFSTGFPPKLRPWKPASKLLGSLGLATELLMTAPAGHATASPTAPATPAASTRNTGRSAQRGVHDVTAHGVERINLRAKPELTAVAGGLITPQQGTQERSVVSRAYIDIQSPTANAFQLLDLVPGANVATSDPFGLSPQTNISIRGLNGDALGYVLEGMPMSDVASYGATPSQFADSENYSQVALQQGSPDLDSPVIDAAGGLITMKYLDPSFKAGGMAAMSYGSYATRRGFIRLETGEIGNSGLRGFVSYSNTRADAWHGPGNNERQHIDFKFLKEWGQSRVSLLGSWNRTTTAYYPKTTLTAWKHYNIHGPNHLARHFDASDPQQGARYWRLWRDPEETLYLGAPMHFALTSNDRLSLDITPYAQGAYGNWPSGTTAEDAGLAGNPTATPVLRGDYLQRSYRAGFTSELHARWKWNDFFLGYWYDYSDDHETQPYSRVSATGATPDIWGTDRHGKVLQPDGRGGTEKYLAWDIHSIAQVNALYAGDHISLFNNRLLIDAGFKEIMLSRNGTNNLPDAASGYPYHVGSNTSEPLPRFGLRWKITPKDQIFLNATTNFRAPAVTAYYAPGDSRGLKNEYSITEELGYRRTGDWLVGSITFFNYNFTNRLIETLISRDGVQNISSTINAGGQTTRGVDIELGTRPWHHLSPYLSFEYLHATMDGNLPVNGDWLPTRGKTAIRSPHFSGAVGLRYDDGHFFSMVTARYTGSQYATFMNDEKMPAYMTADLSLGYRFSNVALFRDATLKRPELRLNFLNLSNQRYLSGVGTPGTNAHATRGLHGTTIAANPAKFYIGGGFAVLFTASTGF